MLKYDFKQKIFGDILPKTKQISKERIEKIEQNINQIKNDCFKEFKNGNYGHEIIVLLRKLDTLQANFPEAGAALAALVHGFGKEFDKLAERYPRNKDFINYLINKYKPLYKDPLSDFRRK